MVKSPPKAAPLVAAALNLVLCENKGRAEQVFVRLLQDYGYLDNKGEPTAKAHRMKVRSHVMINRAPKHFARGVYALDLTTNSGEPELRDNEDGPGFLAEVNYRRVSNPVDGLPEQVLLQFMKDLELAGRLASRPNEPVQITVEFNEPKE